MTPAERQAAAVALVADWPLPSPEQMAQVADLMRPFLAAARTDNTVKTLRPRVPAQRRAA